MSPPSAAGVLDEDGGRGAVEDGAAGAAGDDVIVEQPAADEVVLHDQAGRGGVDLAVDHGGHALAGDLDERVGEGIAEGAHPAHLEREAEGAGLLLQDGADFVGAGGDAAGVHADADPVGPGGGGGRLVSADRRA